MHLCWFDFKPWLSTAESDSRFGYCPTVDLSLRFCWNGWLTRPRQHFHVPQDLVNVHKSMLFSKSRLQMPNAWHQTTTSCRLSLSSRQHFPAICSFFQACTRGKSAVCPTPTIVPLFWVCLVKPRAAALFQLSFLHHCKAKETSSKLSSPCTGGFSCWLTRGSGELGLLWVLLSLWRGVIWMMFVIPFSSTSFWFGPRARFQIFCMALACVCECGDSTGFVSSSFNLPVPLHLRSPGLRRGLSELCSPSVAQVTCFSQQIQTVWSKDNKVVSSCQLLQLFLPS